MFRLLSFIIVIVVFYHCKISACDIVQSICPCMYGKQYPYYYDCDLAIYLLFLQSINLSLSSYTLSHQKL